MAGQTIANRAVAGISSFLSSRISFANEISILCAQKIIFHQDDIRQSDTTA
jgi:hypothetical protein